MASLDSLAADNPNIREQFVEWRLARLNNGEDPFDYEAFRKHIMAIGAPDPGEQEVDDWRAD